MIEAIKVQVDILKVKLAFFSAVIGVVGYIGAHFTLLQRFANQYIVYSILIALLVYGSLGIVYNVVQLNRKYEELENEQ